MKQGKTILLVDSIINILVGAVLLGYSKAVINFFGLPEAEMYFYPNILGALLVGIGIALFIEVKRKGGFIGLGLGGAISINLTAGIVLFLWLVLGHLNIPVQGKIILWILVFMLVGISVLEYLVYLRKRRVDN
jgi:hypothetical protein